MKDSEGIHKDLNVIVALMSKCVREKETKRGRGQMCVPGLVSYYVPLGHTVCVCPGTLFIPDSFVLVPGLTLCATLHIRSFQHMLSQGYEITNVFIHQDGNRLVCCLRKQFSIDSFLEQHVYHGNIA